MQHCCDEMQMHLKGGEVAVNYRDFIREYSVDLRQKTSVQTIQFCPWCGRKLPTDLLERWTAELDSLMLYDPFGKDRANVPDEFWSEKWWQMREL